VGVLASVRVRLFFLFFFGYPTKTIEMVLKNKDKQRNRVKVDFQLTVAQLLGVGSPSSSSYLSSWANEESSGVASSSSSGGSATNHKPKPKGKPRAKDKHKRADKHARKDDNAGERLGDGDAVKHYRQESGQGAPELRYFVSWRRGGKRENSGRTPRAPLSTAVSDGTVTWDAPLLLRCTLFQRKRSKQFEEKQLVLLVHEEEWHRDELPDELEEVEVEVEDLTSQSVLGVQQAKQADADAEREEEEEHAREEQDDERGEQGKKNADVQTATSTHKRTKKTEREDQADHEQDLSANGKKAKPKKLKKLKQKKERKKAAVGSGKSRVSRLLGQVIVNLAEYQASTTQCSVELPVLPMKAARRSKKKSVGALPTLRLLVQAHWSKYNNKRLHDVSGESASTSKHKKSSVGKPRLQVGDAQYEMHTETEDYSEADTTAWDNLSDEDTDVRKANSIHADPFTEATSASHVGDFLRCTRWVGGGIVVAYVARVGVFVCI
jgi:N-terminal C2 in EEIG1 and EHBP1 proteins